MRPVIKAQKISKQYRVGRTGARYSTLRDTLAESFRSIRNVGRRKHTSKQDGTIWALTDVCFEVSPGQVVGIIGRNGAGKSTLLKIISRVTEPTKGRIDLYGRTGSMLEVGTGFHPELTGRENVFLNGAILGMRKVEIARKFDQIVAFSEIEKFIDTPVKFYSSGMYVRLAFAVAAHLEPDILIVDEVLSVGDMAFQQKCLDKLNEIRAQTKAIILVSHNMISIRALCSRVMLLSHGQLTADGNATEVVPLYEKLMYESSREGDIIDEVGEGTGAIQIRHIKLIANGMEQRSIKTGETVNVVIEYDAIERVTGVVAYVALRRPDDFICVATSTRLEGIELPQLEGPGTLTVKIPELQLIPGHYILDAIFYDHNVDYRAYFFGRKRIEFSVTSDNPSLDALYGVYYQKQIWKIDINHRKGLETSMVETSRQ